jgi:hypothetical protein
MTRAPIPALILIAGLAAAGTAMAAPVNQGKRQDPQVFSLADCDRLRAQYLDALPGVTDPGTRKTAEMFGVQAANQCGGNYAYSGVMAYSRALQIMGRDPVY